MEGENAKELGSVANVITVPVDVRRKGKMHEKIKECENDKHVTCHSELHNTNATVGSGHWYKNWLYLNGHDPMDCHMLVL